MVRSQLQVTPKEGLVMQVGVASTAVLASLSAMVVVIHTIATVEVGTVSAVEVGTVDVAAAVLGIQLCSSLS